jgi:hypothetical protein
MLSAFILSVTAPLYPGCLNVECFVRKMWLNVKKLFGINPCMKSRRPAKLSNDKISKNQ